MESLALAPEPLATTVHIITGGHFGFLETEGGQGVRLRLGIIINRAFRRQSNDTGCRWLSVSVNKLTVDH